MTAAIIVGSLFGAIALLGSVAMICFKGITFHKKMEIVPTKQPVVPTRSEEMDNIEKILNEANQINKINNQPKDAPTHAAPVMGNPMDTALKNIMDAFGPELPPEDPNGGS